MSANTFAVQRGDIRRIHSYDDGSATGALSSGAVRLRVGPFAFTSNNITYATFGDAMNYFDFFPSPDPGNGRIPVWGFADVVESGVAGVPVGERYFGYFPPSSHCILQPTRITEARFTDGAAHRRERAPIYNQYTRCSADPGYVQEQEAQIALLRPLFGTAFLLDDFFSDAGFFGADTLLLSSASSKTAYGTAFCLAERRGSPSAVRIAGLTSRENLDFTRRLGCYDVVVTYEEIAELALSPTAYVDMAGNAELRATVHRHFGDALKYDCIVGGTHWDARGSQDSLPGPTPTVFFAPAQAKKRSDEWGPDGLAARIGRRWSAFMKPVCDSEEPWLRVVRGQGLAAVLETYQALLDGRVPADEGHVLTI